MKNIYVLLLLLASINLFAQEDDDLGSWEYHAPNKQDQKGPKPIANKISFGTGIANYYGDLNSSFGSFNPGLSYALGMRFFVKKQVTFQPQISFFKLKGDDSKQGDAIRNLSFESNNIECSLNLLYDFTKYEYRWDLRKKVSPYVIGNVGVLFFNPKAEIDGVKIELQNLQTEGVDYNTVTFTAALGLGTHIAITKRSNLNFEFRYTFTLSNYLDDVHGNYQDPKDLNGYALQLADRTFEGGNTPTESYNGIHWNEGTKRGSSSLKDRYALFYIQYEVDVFKHSIVYPAF